MFSRIIKFLSDYKQFALVLATTIVALVLDIAGKDSIAHIILSVVSIGSVIILLWDMLQTLREGRYGVDILAATAIITSVLLGEYWAGIIIVLMLTGGEALEDYAEDRAKGELTELLKKAPQTATILKSGKQIVVKVSEVKVGDIILVKPGDLVPVDAKIIEGESNFNESSLTGESLPVPKNIGDSILSGSVNEDGSITAKAIHTSKDSQYEQIISLVKSAADSQSPFVRLTDRYSIPFTVISFAIAGTMWIVTGDPNRFLQILVVATPCPLLLAAPIALISGMSRAAKNGIIVKSGSVLEKLAEVKSIGFDKTGTLTEGKPVVSNITVYNGYDDKSILSLAAGLEHQSTHVLAVAIINKADDEKVKIQKYSSIKEHSGHGIEAKLKGKTVLIGSLRFIKEQRIDLQEKLNLEKIQSTASYLLVDNKLAGIIEFEDALRTNSAATISSLRKLGIKYMTMVTGDKKEVAEKLALQSGVDSFEADCLPKDKIIAVQNMKKNHAPVAFVGDGVNDAPVLTASDVGIALGAKGSTAASEAADVVIMLDDISKVSQSREIATRTFSIARQSILIGIGMSFALMAMFATGRFSPTLGAILQEFVDVAVIINALRAHYGSFKYAPSAKVPKA
jgi:heavy metal translocating P-type ATPase